MYADIPSAQESYVVSALSIFVDWGNKVIHADTPMHNDRKIDKTLLQIKIKEQIHVQYTNTLLSAHNY